MLQSSVDILLGRGPSLSFSNSGFFQSHPLATLFNNIPLFRRADHLTTLPITEGLPGTIRVPAVTGPSCQSGLYQVDSLVSEPIQRFPFILFQRNIMSTGNSLCGEAEMAARHLDNLHLRSGQILSTVTRADVYFCNKSLDYCTRVSGSLKNREPWGNNMIYKCFWSNATGKRLGPNPFIEHRTKGILSLWSAAYSTRAAPDVSFDCSPREEQPENSSCSSHQYVSCRLFRMVCFNVF